MLNLTIDDDDDDILNNLFRFKGMEMNSFMSLLGLQVSESGYPGGSPTTGVETEQNKDCRKRWLTDQITFEWIKIKSNIIFISDRFSFIQWKY